MKTLLNLIICFSIIIKIQYSQSNTELSKFYPLNIGNRWVYYNGGHGIAPWHSRNTVVKDTIINNYLFYKIKRESSSGYSEYFYRRFDTLTGDLLDNGLGCFGNINHSIVDSMKSSIGNTCACNLHHCKDTNQTYVFGIYRKTKAFTWSNTTYRYAKEIGLCSLETPGPFYSYSDLDGCIINGILYGDTSFPIGINKISSEVSEKFSLLQNYPNPFNPSTKIRFEIPSVGAQYIEPVQLIIYDILGREATTLVNEKFSPGTYEVEFDGSNYPSGVYYYTLSSRQAGSSTEDFIQTKKMVLLK